MIKLTLHEGTIYLLNFLVYLYRYNVPKIRIVWGKLLYILDFQKFIFHPFCFFSVQHLKMYLLGHMPLKKKVILDKSFCSLTYLCLSVLNTDSRAVRSNKNSGWGKRWHCANRNYQKFCPTGDTVRRFLPYYPGKLLPFKSLGT